MILNFRKTALSVLIALSFLSSAASIVLADQGKDEVYIDVRTWFEHKIDHIDGDIRVHYTDIVGEVSQQFPDKTTPIRLYCAAGVRSEKAVKALQEVGYTDVVNVGGIEDVRQARGLNQNEQR